MKTKKNTTPLRTALIYAFFGILWILASDLIAGLTNPAASNGYQITQSAKGIFFVLASACLIYFIVRKDMRSLRESEERFRSLIEHGPNNISLLSADGTLLWESPAAIRTLEYKHNQFKGQSIFNLVHPDDLEWIRQKFVEMLDKPGGTVRGSFRLRHSNGSWRWVEGAGTNLLHEPSVNAIVINYHDVTERREMERSLYLSQQQLYTLVKEAPICIAMFDTEMKYIVASHRWVREYGNGRTDLVGRSHYEIHPEIPERWREMHRRGMAGETLHNDDDLWVHEDGRREWQRWAIVPWYDEHGKISGIILSAENITERKEAEEALRISEGRYRMAQAMGHVGNWEYNLQTTEFWGSDEAKRIYGFDPKQPNFTTEEVENCIPERERVHQALVDLVQADKPYNLEFEIHPKNSSKPRIISSIAELKRDEHGNPLLVTGVIQDITERKEAEKALAHSEQAYRDLFENMPIGLYRTSADGIILDANPTLVKMFGYAERESLMGRNIVDFYLDPADDERFRREIENVNTLSNFEAEYRREDGTTFWTEDHIRAARDEAGGVLFYEGSLIDITERKHAEKATRYYTNQLKAVNAAAARLQKLYSPQVLANEIIETLEDILHYTYGAVLLLEGERLSTYTLGTEGRKEEETAVIKGGIERQEIRLGRGITGWVAETGEKVRVGDVRHDKRYLAVRENIRSELCVPLKAGESIIGVVNVESVRPDAYSETDESVLETVAAQISVAIQNARLFEQVRQQSAELEQRVQERTAELVRANRAKDEFLANMSHELRTPLNGIMGFAEMLMQGTRGPVSEKQAQDLGIIHSSGQHLLGLINDILDISKIEAGNFELHSEVIPLNSVCQSSLAFIKQLAHKKSITVEYLPAAPAAMIFADPKRLKQILVNLLNNAVKFTPERGIIKLEVREDIEASQVRFSVTDSGIGIAPENLQKLFEPFVQLDSSLSRQHEGTGLGLSLVKKLVELHGGSVEVESELGRGSCFRVNIPIRLQNVTGGDARETIDRDLLGKTAPLVFGRNSKRILITEDNPINMMVTSDFLTSKGHEVIEAKNGMEAIEKARERNPALILMDIQMPDMNGFETIKRIRELPEFGSTPIIALTALAMPGDRERCLEAGANEYLTKPVSLKTLAELIEDLLQRGDHR